MALRVLSLEDVAYDVELMERELRKASIEYELKRVETQEQFLAALTEFQPDIILADYSLPHFSALEALKLLRQHQNATPVILVTGSHSEEAAVECMKEGAEDYILKASLTRLPSALQNALRKKEAEREIEHLATFPRFNPNPVLEFSADGALMYFNDAARALAQTSGYEHPTEILPPNSDRLVERCLATGQRQAAETQVSGRTIAWKFYAIQPTHTVHCYAEDITDRLSLEAQLRRSQKMESIGQLAAGIAHDFNNILTVIQGHSSLLLHDPRTHGASCESLKHICVAAERAASLTRQLLLFSRKQPAQPRTLDLNAAIDSVAGMLRVLLGESISLELDLAKNLPAVEADEGMMEQVLMNLAVNSRDAMPRGGRLTIATAERDVDSLYARRVREARAGHFVTFRVSDTGTGMTRETLAHIFEPFFTTKDVGKGTGLGLATVYGIVKQHQGWVEVETREGAGSTFTIFLPASPRPAEVVARPRPGGDTLPRGTETVLVVEDEEPLRNLVTEVLRHAGYTVFDAATGAEALETWRRHRREIDLLLTDVMMPEGMSGRELAEKILAEEPRLRVLLTSGYPMEAIQAETARPEHAFLQKPFSPASLARAVRECLDAQPAAARSTTAEAAHAH